MTGRLGVPAPGSASRHRRPLVAALIAAAVAGVAVAVLLPSTRPADPLPVLGAVPEFVLTERSGRPVRRSDLDGVPWVADFIFSRCTGMCPALSTRMADLRRRVAAAGLRARFVSFAVDPAHDTSDVLRAYADRVGATGDDWLFVTGSREALLDLIGLGFRLSVEERSPAAVAASGGDLIAHSDRFVLVDGAGQIRGYYHGLDAETGDRLVADLTTLNAAP